MSIVFDIKPMGKPRLTRRDKWKKRPVMLRWLAFKDSINWLAKSYKYEVSPILKIDFFVQVPTSWSQKKKDKMIGKPHQQKPDLDNYIKAWADSLCKEDSFIHEVHARKFWSDKNQIIVY